MSSSLKILFALFFACFAAFGQEAEDAPSEPRDVDFAPPGIEAKGQQVFLRGNLGKLVEGRGAEHALNGLLNRNGAGPIEDLVDIADKVDGLGLRHVRVQQHFNGLPVVGSQMIVHADSAGDIYAINGSFVDPEKVAETPVINGRTALVRAMRMANLRGAKLVSNPELTYVIDGQGGAFLAWSAMISYDNEDGPQMDRLFGDAAGGEKFARHPQHHTAKNRLTYDGNNGTSLPGTLARSEGQGPVGDAAIDAAHDNAGTTYDFYNSVFGRDSYNNGGATLVSTAHHRVSYNNAFWNNSQMVYGDGDGVNFSPLSQSLDVVAHELTHAVTSTESNLIYSYESGAINESMSDVFGAACEAWSDGSVNSDVWKIGDEIYTPGTSGDALRYMNNPTADGSSYDYYPERYTGSADNGGVHWNSGIGNLAFYLLVQGGTHPRGKTSNTVPGIGMTKAQAIFYRANTVYLGPSSNYQALRDACAQSALDLYSSTEENAVQEAFDAVGVPGGGGGPGGGCSNTTYTGNLTGTGDYEYEPNGTYYYSSGGTQTATLTGPGGTDFDLYLWRWNGYGWATVASSLSPTSNESISYSGSGYFVWRVYSYSGSGSYTLCATP